VISSSAFAASKQCNDFLRLLVERALAGEVERLGERTVGAEVFGRPADYERSNDAPSVCERRKFARGLHSITERPSKTRRCISN
jgi:hypothetical protein